MLAAFVVAAALSTPTVCLDGRCAPASSAFAAAESARSFVRISGDRQHVDVGVLPAGATTLPADSNPATHAFSIRFTDAPAPLTFELTGETATWSWTLKDPPRDAIALSHPPAAVRLRIRAEGYNTAERRLGADASLGTIYLRRTPVIRGVVTDGKTDAPVAGADVSLSSGQAPSATDSHGRFRFAITEAWPQSIRIAAPRRAPLTVNVPPTVTDTDLGTLVLREGGSIHVHLLPPVTGDTEHLTWQLRRPTRNRGTESAREGAVAPGQTRLSIDGVEEGKYLLIIRGETELQQFGVPIAVRDAQATEVPIAIQPTLLEVSVRQGGQPVARANVTITHDLAGWEGTVHCDSTGTAREELWQQGDVSLFVSSAEPFVPGWQHSESIAGNERARLSIVIPNHRIHGRVLDAATAAPLGGARVLVRNGRSTVSALSSDTGTYELSALENGSASIRVLKSGYRDDQQWQIAIGDEDADLERDLAVEALRDQRRVQVVTTSGTPIPSAAIVVATAYGARQAGVTDENGVAIVPLRTPDEHGMIFAVPPSGSLGFRHFSADDPEILLRVAPGSASMTVLTRDVAGEPVARVGILMRIDSVMLPIPALQALARIQGVPLQSDAEGRITYPYMPPGHYELWPVTNRREFESVYSSTPPAPPIDMTVAPGTQTLVLKFEPKRE